MKTSFKSWGWTGAFIVMILAVVVGSILLSMVLTNCAVLRGGAPDYKATAGLTFRGEPVPLLIPSDLPDFTIGGPAQGGYITMDIIYLIFLMPETKTQYILIAMAACPQILALMVVEEEKTRNWIYGTKGTPIQAGEGEMKALLEMEHKCPPPSLET
jgi:hypothetical protein